VDFLANCQELNVRAQRWHQGTLRVVVEYFTHTIGGTMTNDTMTHVQTMKKPNDERAGLSQVLGSGLGIRHSTNKVL
jgi:hypothetical protein